MFGVFLVFILVFVSLVSLYHRQAIGKKDPFKESIIASLEIISTKMTLKRHILEVLLYCDIIEW